MAADGNPAVQMVLPMAEMVGWLRQGVGELIRQVGLQVMELLMEEEVRERVGERSQPQPDRTANRWGKERGFCVVMGQKVPMDRPRVRTTDDQEVRLGSYFGCGLAPKSSPRTCSCGDNSRCIKKEKPAADGPAPQPRSRWSS